MPQLKIATFNVNGIRSRLNPLLQWLDKAKPDVACLQELKAPEEAFPIDAIRDAGYGAIWHGQRSWNGVAILARGADPVESRRVVKVANDDGTKQIAMLLTMQNTLREPQKEEYLAWQVRPHMLTSGRRKQLPKVVLDNRSVPDGDLARERCAYPPIAIGGCVGKRLYRGQNVERVRQNDLITRPRSLQAGDDLSVIGEIVDEFSLDRQLHSVLDFRNGTNTLQDLSRLSLKLLLPAGTSIVCADEHRN